MTDRNVDDVVAVLRDREPELDDVHRARLLAHMSPELDAIAEHHAARADARVRTHRRWWLPVLAVAAAAAGVGLWLGRDDRVAQPPVAHVDRQMLAPYVVAGVASDDVAMTLLAGRFAGLDAKPGELVRATVDRDRDQRIAIVGPGKLVAHDDASLELVAGTLLVDARDPARALHVRIGELDVRAQNVRFGVAIVDRTAVVFVDRGELVVGDRRVAAGQWLGPDAQRSQALVTAVRDHGNAIAPADDRGGVAAVAASEGNAASGGAASEGNIVTEGGAVVGRAPLWVRLPAGDVVLVATGVHERRTPVTIREGTVSRVAAPPAATPAPPAPIEILAPLPATTLPAPAVKPAATAHAIATTAADLYARAEAALATNDRTFAESLWRELVQRFPHSSQAASALYDLAGLARARGDFAAAQDSLAKLDAGETPAALREPSAYLRCRLHVDAGEPTVAASCFEAFRTRFDKSAHDAEVLAWLIGYAQETSGCAAARLLADEYLRRFPTGAFAKRARDCATP
jgi:TolA-binding protein